MIRSIRSLFNSRLGTALALLFVAMIALAFALGDVTGSGSFGGLGGGNVAKVGSRTISLGELNQSLDNRMRSERQQNPTLDMGRFVEGGGLDVTIDQLINRYAIAEFGEKYGVAVSKRLVDFEIRKIPGVNGLDGKFSQQQLQVFLGQLGLTEKLIRDDFTQNLFAQQVLPATYGGTKAADGITLPYASLLLEKRVGQLAIIPSTVFLPSQPPSETELSKYYRDNSVQFTIPEKRAISYAIFNADIVADRAKPTEAEIAAYYKDEAARYSASETRDISQVIAPTEAAATVIADNVQKGQSMAAAAKSVGLSVSTSKAVSKDMLTANINAAVANAVFATQAPNLTKPVRGGLGWYIIRVDAVQKVAARPLNAVSDEIAKTLSAEKAQLVLAELTTEIEDEFANGATIADVAKAQGLKIETTPKLLADGTNITNPNYKPIDAMKVILPAAFQMDRDGDPQLIETVPGQEFAMIYVADIEEAAPPPLAQVRDIITQQWALAQGSKKAKLAAEKVSKAVTAGQSLNDALAALKVKLPPLQTVSGTRADLDRDGQPLPPPLALLFSMKEGTAKSLAAPGQNGWFIVKAEKVIKGDATGQSEMLAARRAELSALINEEYAAQLIQSAMADVGVKKNNGVITDLRNRLTKNDFGN